MKSATSSCKETRRTEPKHVNQWIAIHCAFLAVIEPTSMKQKGSEKQRVLCQMFEHVTMFTVLSLSGTSILPREKLEYSKKSLFLPFRSRSKEKTEGVEVSKEKKKEKEDKEEEKDKDATASTVATEVEAFFQILYLKFINQELS